MLSQFNKHSNLGWLFPSYQMAYCKFRSCETLLIKLTDDILWNMENQKVTSLVVMDLSAAFNTVDHQILSNALLNQYSVEDNALAWFNIYLQPRRFQVDVNGAGSLERYFNYGVAQVSCGGTILYTAYCYIKFFQCRFDSYSRIM